MNTSRRLATALVTLASVAGCAGTDRDVSPTRPSRPGPPPNPVSTVSGEITIRSLDPPSDAIVPVHRCAPGSPRFCADQPQITLDVVVDQDIPNAIVWVAFDRCALGRTGVTALSAGQRTSTSISALDLSDDGPLHDGVGAALLCALPAVTTAMTVSLWRSDGTGGALLTREFANRYTFATR